MGKLQQLVNSIQVLQEQSKALEPNSGQRHYFTQAVNEYADEFLTHIHDKAAYIDGDGKELYQLPIQEMGRDIHNVLAILNQAVDTPGLNPASGGYLGYIPGGGIYHAALGDYLADVSNRISALYYLNPGAVRMENLLIRWMADLIGYPGTAGGNLASGGSISNLIAIVTARDAHRLKCKNFNKTVVYLSEQVHHCVDKSLRIAGLGEVIKRYVPLDNDYRMIPHQLARMIAADKAAGLQPWLLIASAGTTNTGAIDPLVALNQIAKLHQLWFHVDAAYGGFFILTPQGKQLLQGIETADSVVLDPHKGLFLPNGLGVVLIKDKQHLLRAHSFDASYLEDAQDDSDQLSPAELSPELSKHFRGLRLWLPLQLLGVAPFRAALNEKLLLAQYFYQQLLTIPGMELACEPQLSVVTFRYVPLQGDPNNANQNLLASIRRNGRVFLSSTNLNGRIYLRLACLSFRTHLDLIDYTLSMIKHYIGEYYEFAA